MSNKIKSEALGMSHGTAANRLRKNILFDLICRLGLNFCHQCGTEIESAPNLSIEHKTPWLRADKPIDAFFDLDNIAFSHLSCNAGAATRVNKTDMSRAEYRASFNEYQREYRNLMSPEKRRVKRRERYLRTGR